MQIVSLFIAFALVLSFALPPLPSLSAQAAQAAPPARTTPGALQQPSFRGISSELVVLPVVVKDKKGRYVADLPRERFVVYDNDRRVSIDLFSNEDTPVTVGLIVDASGSMQPKLGEVIAAATIFARSSHPDDELFAIRFNDNVRDALGGRPFLLASDLREFEAALTSLVPEGRTALYDALVAGLDHLEHGTKPRKALIVISDGGDNASRATLDQVLTRARKSNAAIYTIGMYDEFGVDKNSGALKALAKATGGERFEPNSPGKVLQVCERIARELRSGYTIGYVPPDRDGLFHRVRVAVEPAPQRLDIRTRPGYFASAAVEAAMR